jgi:hypothetical protein
VEDNRDHDRVAGLLLSLVALKQMILPPSAVPSGKRILGEG